MGEILFLVILASLAGATLNYAAFRWASHTIARAVLLISIAPMLGLLAYSLAVFSLAEKTNDMRYFGADMALGLTLIANIIWVPMVYLGAHMGSRSKREGTPS